MGSTGAEQPKHHGHRRAKVVWWKRPLPWVGAILTATVIAIATAFGTGIGQKLSSAATGNPAPASAPTESTATPLVPAGRPTLTPADRESPRPSPVLIEDLQVEFYQDYSFVSPVELILNRSKLAKLAASWSTWPQSPGMVMANQQWIILTLAGNESAPVTINNMTILKICQAPLKGGTLFYDPTHGSGPYPTAPIYFNLDEPVSTGQFIINNTTGTPLPPGGNFFQRQVVTLKYHEPQTFAIYLTSSHHFCQFTFQLSIATAEGPATETITDNGRPFALTADGETKEALLDGRWIQYNPVSKIPFSNYAAVYAGGVPDQQNSFRFIRVNPATYHGGANPPVFPSS